LPAASLLASILAAILAAILSPILAVLGLNEIYFKNPFSAMI
jgi:hypothetical protein